jgi:hypothetical protein
MPPSPPPVAPVVVRSTFNFANGTEGFAVDIADYRPGMETGSTGINLVIDSRALPPPLADKRGLFVGATNRSDDLFTFIWREVSGLAPGQQYRIDTELTIATNVPTDCVGVGGSPGEGVAIKTGATPVFPQAAITPPPDGNIRVNFEKDRGPLAVGGNQVFTIGDFSGGQGTCNNGIYALKTLRAAEDRRPVITTDAFGRLWYVIGTDSGFESRTEIYYLDGAATFTPI